MTRIMFVEDDLVIARIYREGLVAAGYDVLAAQDGLEAIKQLPVHKPDIVVLDLMMPRLGGLDVLKFMRADSQLKLTPVIVFSNAFLGTLGDQASAFGVEEMLIKSAVTPKQLAGVIQRVLMRPGVKKELRVDGISNDGSADFARRIRNDFFAQVPLVSRTFVEIADNFLNATDDAARVKGLEALGRKADFLTHMTGMAGCYRVAQLASAFEALLFQLQEKPLHITDSSRRTVRATVDLIVQSLSRADHADEQCLSPTNVLVVEDDPVANRAIVSALGRSQLAGKSVTDPMAALETLERDRFDAVLLDIDLPGMDGIQLSQKMRSLPLHRDTPVIFITSHAGFLEQARAILRAGDDLIAKPILPIELTVKVMSLVFKARVAKGSVA